MRESEVAMTLCEAHHPHGELYCTLEKGHGGGDHIATAGPYRPGIPVLARWAVASSTPAPRAEQPDEPVMPIPTPEPPVTRYDMEHEGCWECTGSEMKAAEAGEWVKWADVETVVAWHRDMALRFAEDLDALKHENRRFKTLLLQRAQEIAELQVALQDEHDLVELQKEAVRSAGVARDRLKAGNDRFQEANHRMSREIDELQKERDAAHALLTARAQEIEQVKAAVRATALWFAEMDNPDIGWGDNKSSSEADLQHVERVAKLRAEAKRAVEAADAALVSRAPVTLPLDPPLHISGHYTLGDSGKYVAHNVAAFMSFVFAAMRLSPIGQATVSDREIVDEPAAPLPASAALQDLSCCPDCGGGWTFDFGQKRVYCRTCQERKPTV